jgi:CspA family cold shock protein
MNTGKLKWFNEDKGYGFIQPSDGSKDVFVHITALQRAGIPVPDEGTTLEYGLEDRRGKTCACDVRVVQSDE